MKKFKILAMLACLVACAAIAGPALAGTAYYGGFSDETGVPVWYDDVSGRTAVLAAQDPGYEISIDAGTAIGNFTTDGATALAIPDSADLTTWVLTAEWDLPAPNAIPGRDHYFYIGFDVGAIDNGRARIGTEYKDKDGDTIKEFVIREQAATVTPNEEYVIPAGSHLHIRQTCVRAGDPVFAGGDAVFEEYRVNYGPWTPYLNSYGVTWIPLLAFGLDGQTHYITFKVRGLGGVIDPKITGFAVPDVNIGADHDGDTVLDENDPWPGNAAWSVDSDSDDMADEWEILYFGDLSETAAGNPDGDIFDNLDEFLGGSNPAIADVFTTLGQFGLMALLTALAVVGMVVLVRRRRVTA